MPDWKKIVRDRLAETTSELSGDVEVVNELASHMEELHGDALLRGLQEIDAIKFCFEEAGDWKGLAARIVRAKRNEETMNHRTKALWIPALAAFLGTSLSLMLCQIFRVRPHILWVNNSAAVWLYWPWLLTLPMFGGAGAYLSLRAHGSIAARVAAGLSPAWIMLTALFLILPVSLAIDGLHVFQVVGLSLLLLGWIALPALALLVGALPFLGSRSLRQYQQ